MAVLAYVSGKAWIVCRMRAVKSSPALGCHVACSDTLAGPTIHDTCGSFPAARSARRSSIRSTERAWPLSKSGLPGLLF